LPFARGSLDVIISNSTLDHFATRQEITGGLAELSRCLKAGGLPIVTMDNGSNILYPLLRLLGKCGIGPYHIGPTLSIKGLVAGQEKVGLKVTHATALIHNPRLLITLAAHTVRALCPRRAERWIQAMLRFFERLDGRRTQFLTGCFIATRAVKVPSGPDGAA
jgi:hypothetical protein